MLDPDDLTTRARIRNAAIELIGTHGFQRTSLRMIAKAAGVSPALIVHHFGDKDGLRAACNTHVVAMFTEDGADEALTIELIQSALNDLDAYGPALNYLAQLLADDSAAADEVFDGILSGTLRTIREQEAAGIIHPQSDPAGSALLLTLFGLAPLVLGRQFARALGAEKLTPAVTVRITIPMLELFTHGFYANDSILRAAQSAMEQMERQSGESL
ncbi:MAG: TetR family transcriptional regulator [Propionibacteriaceae bacterium]|jgi:AcrR family transcriptional regulator|nr:TetR family transcriptional regulator [Propionibacteriaceae bacterium]